MLNTFGDSHLNEPIKSSKWSEELKSTAFTIEGNVATLTQWTDQHEFCLLDCGFSHLLNTKQSWTISIKRKTVYLILLGVCLKKKMQSYNFSYQNIQWRQTGHGLYMIDLDGRCLSHSQKEFNDREKKSFPFGQGDAITCEYDPIELKLKFMKNNSDYFEMPIIKPPEDDEYHPCVAIYESSDSVQLIRQ